MQAPSRYVPPSHHIPEILPSLQIPRRGPGDRGRGRFHGLPSLFIEQEVISKE